jgi:SAM-dependent methyltransferase
MGPDTTPPLRAAIDALAGADLLGLDGTDLYEDLAPVYDFVAERRYDYDATAGFVDEHVPADARSVAVGACGGGHLLARLASRYEQVLGIDLSRAMLGLSAARTDAPIVRADLTSFVAPGAFDAITMLGGSVAHLPTDDGTGTDGVVAFFERAAESLAPGGVFLCDFIEAGALESGHVVRDTYTDDRFRVKRTVVTTADSVTADLGRSARFTYGYEITDTEAGEAVRAGTSVPVREFEPGVMLGAALAAGFTDVTLATPPTHGRGLVARRGE